MAFVDSGGLERAKRQAEQLERERRTRASVAPPMKAGAMGENPLDEALLGQALVEGIAEAGSALLTYVIERLKR
jgi:hypothetical protein